MADISYEHGYASSRPIVVVNVVPEAEKTQQKKTRKRRATRTDAAKKKQKTLWEQSRIHIGSEIERWKELRKSLGDKTKHHEVAALLLSTYHNKLSNTFAQSTTTSDEIPPQPPSISRLENSTPHYLNGILTEPVATRCHLSFMNCLYTRNVYRQWLTFRDELNFVDDKEFMSWCLTTILSHMKEKATIASHTSHVDIEVRESVRASRAHLMSLYGTDTYLKYCDIMQHVGIVSHHRYMMWVIKKVQSITSQENASQDAQESREIEEDEKGNILVDVRLNLSNSQNQAPVAADGEQEQDIPGMQSVHRDHLPPTESEDHLGQLPPTESEDQGQLPPTENEDQGQLPPAESEDLEQLPPAESEDPGQLPPAESEDQGQLPPAESEDLGQLPPTESEDLGQLPPAENEGFTFYRHFMKKKS